MRGVSSLPTNMIQKAQGLVAAGRVKTLVLAGGGGTRLKGICDPAVNRWAYPKPSLTVGPRRLIDFSIAASHELGAKDVCFATWHLAESIEFLAENRARELGISTECVLETEPRDTAGACKFIIEEQGWQKEDNQIFILSADIIHNLDLVNPLALHLSREAAATIAVNEIPWTDMYRFGSVRLEGMPQRMDFKSDDDFKEAVGEWVIKHRGQTVQIVEFREKMPESVDSFYSLKERTDLRDAETWRDIYAALEEKHKHAKKNERLSLIHEDIRRDHLALSHLNNSSIYLTSADFWRAFGPHITFKKDDNPFSDFGKHIWAALASQSAGDKGLLHSRLPQGLRERILAGRYPFFAYIMPGENDFGKPIYWRDAGIANELLQVNHDVLRGLIYVGLGKDPKFAQRKEDGVWIGRDNVYIASAAQIVPLRQGAREHEIASIISHDVVVERRVKVENSIIGSFVKLGEGSIVENSVIMSPHFRKREEQGLVHIGENVVLKDCIVVGADIEPGREYSRQVIMDPAGGVVTEPL